MLSSPLVRMALDMILKLPNDTKLAIVETVSGTLGVRAGFWDTSPEPPVNVACVCELDDGRHALASFNGSAWHASDQNAEPLPKPVKRWALIPA